ncbi:hypothetical protein RDWZM_008642 [Blomia tropicalis]|uniref:Uncharacterized protein n=1 Tax=Blomia tropicalis TaxID=40697 RepID=A0A9Q0M1E0_BLOTA|nr:hypothetical protein RDWZM_008642 [Blomia tropicalis]
MNNVLQQFKDNNSIHNKRFYRFGRRVNRSGFYVSPNWFDQEFSKENNLKNVVKDGGIILRSNKIFDDEKKRQASLVNRIEKISVQLEKPFAVGEDYSLMMNRAISTPFDCAKHISQLVTERSALAIVDGTELWHMHQPLNRSCHLRFLHFKHPDTMPVNYAFWRSCSMLLARVVKRCFKEQFSVQILSQPISDLKYGSFICDAKISNLVDWKASPEELRTLTSLLWDETNKSTQFERLEVNREIANQLFSDNSSRLTYIESIKEDRFVVYRLGDYIELCNEPMIANTNQMNSMYLCAVHPLKTPTGEQFYRFQGIGLPKQLHINAFAYSLLRERAKNLNQIGFVN